ncbi:hypothetical protein [Niabella hibiscisoli]|uniref:hypothetical protein n=1 Tax=Niabella hibiscisoli TaxID=1825928 RepID=UPI001F10D312|nr:hypothetical protein [Niabella hibiscisoli]MCH5720647.1 hypothetical protein [Niabella hibiscisoli]
MAGCTKNRLAKFNTRIVGSWQLVEVNTFGLGSSNIVFNGGYFTFNSNNTAMYYDRNNNSFTGTWYIDAYVYTDDEGDSETDFILSVDVGDGRSMKFDRFEIPRFGNTNRFKAKVRNGLNVVTYVFERR